MFHSLKFPHFLRFEVSQAIDKFQFFHAFIYNWMINLQLCMESVIKFEIFEPFTEKGSFKIFQQLLYVLLIIF